MNNSYRGTLIEGAYAKNLRLLVSQITNKPSSHQTLLFFSSQFGIDRGVFPPQCILNNFFLSLQYSTES